MNFVLNVAKLVRVIQIPSNKLYKFAKSQFLITYYIF